MICCVESWNLHKHEDPHKAVFEIVGCFCSHNDVCAGYDVTTSKLVILHSLIFKILKTFIFTTHKNASVIPSVHKRGVAS